MVALTPRILNVGYRSTRSYFGDVRLEASGPITRLLEQNFLMKARLSETLNVLHIL